VGTPDGCPPGLLEEMDRYERKIGGNGEGSVGEDVGEVGGDDREQETGQG